MKKEGVSINTPFSALSRRMKFGSNSTGDRSFKMMSSRSIGLLSDRSGSVMSHRSGGLLSHRSAGKDYDGMEDGSEDGVEDAARCLYQQRALRNGIEGACSVEQWQRPLIAIREYYISFPPPALEAPPRRISITNLMTSLVDSPKKPLIKPLSRTKLEAQTRAPSSYCVVSWLIVWITALYPTTRIYDGKASIYTLHLLNAFHDILLNYLVNSQFV